MSNRSEKELVRDDYPLPQGIPGVLALVRSVLEGGQVERVIIDQEVVRAWRWQEVDDFADREDDPLDSAIRNAEHFFEHEPDGMTEPAVLLVDLYQLIDRENYHPYCWVTGTSETPDKPLLERWLFPNEKFRPRKVERLFNLPVKRVPTLPEETFALVGTSFPEADDKDINIVVKTSIVLGRRHAPAKEEQRNGSTAKVNEDDARGRNHPPRGGSAPREAPPDPGGSSGDGWSPAGFLRGLGR